MIRKIFGLVIVASVSGGIFIEGRLDVQGAQR